MAAQVVAHPMVTSSDEDKFRYLQVLTLLIDADDVILDEEIEYLRRMVQIFGLENGTLGKLIKFVQLLKPMKCVKPWPRFMTNVVIADDGPDFCSLV